ncbi:MAG: ABC transporter ATP-binding protein [Candidatus Riflebacteria bacterium]|nr:ABC transporter ATP-binding protein [Candidatus Riflebacteria bacterium]
MAQAYIQEDEDPGKIYDGRLFRRLLPFLKPWTFPACFAVVMVIGGMTLFLFNPYIIGRVIDEGIKPRNQSVIIRLSFIYLGIEILVYLFYCVQNYLLQYVGQKVMYDLRVKLFSHLQRLPASFFDKNPVGRLVTRITNDTASLSELFSSGLVIVLGDIFLVFGIAVALLCIQPKLGLATLSTCPLLILSAWYFQDRIRTAYRKVRLKIALLNGALSENISGIRVIQVFSCEEKCAKKFDSLNIEHTDAQLESLFHHSVFTPVITIINGLTITIILFMGGKMLLAGEISTGIFVSFISYVQHFFFPIRDMSEKATIFQSAMAAAEKIFNLLDEKVEISIDEGISEVELEGKIDFKGVQFSYIPGQKVLKGISFSVKPGQSVAIVGHTGAGKTTIASLLNRTYEIDGGEILIDNRDLRDYSKNFLRQNIALIQQEVFLFSGNAFENIRLWNEKISRERVEEIAVEINADKFILNMPNGFDSEILERGVNLSAGQRQLIAFARAMAFNPKILILDEATSSVDSNTEKLIQEAIKKLILGRTSIVIAHRLSTIKNCEKILVMHHGRLVEEGTHESLLEKNGYYKKLYELQFVDKI